MEFTSHLVVDDKAVNIDSLYSTVEKISRSVNCVNSKSGVIMTFVMPFLKLLGYDITNPVDVVPSFCYNGSEVIDFCVLVDNLPHLVLECVCSYLSLDCDEMLKLRECFNLNRVSLAIFTNGLEYWLFIDSVKSGYLDDEPFFKFNLLNLGDKNVSRNTEAIVYINLLHRVNLYKFSTLNLLRANLADKSDRVKHLSRIHKRDKEKISNLDRELMSKDDIIKELSRKNEILKSESIHSLVLHNSSYKDCLLEEKADSLVRTVVELEDSLSKVSSLESSSNDKNTKLDDKDKEIESLTRMVKDLEDKLSSLESSSIDADIKLGEKNIKINGLVRTVSEKDSKIEDLLKTIKELKAKVNSLQGKSALKIELTECQVKNLNDEIKSLKSRLDVKDSELKYLKRDLDEKTELLEKKDLVISSWEEQLSEFKQLKRDLDEKTELLEKKDLVISQLEKQLNKLSRRYNNDKITFNNLQNEYNHSQGIINNLQTELKTYRDKQAVKINKFKCIKRIGKAIAVSFGVGVLIGLFKFLI